MTHGPRHTFPFRTRIPQWEEQLCSRTNRQAYEAPWTPRGHHVITWCSDVFSAYQPRSTWK